MNNKEKLYLIKLAAVFGPDLPPRSSGPGQEKHAPGSVGAAFQPNNVNYSGKVGPAIGSRGYRALPQEQRQGLIGMRDAQQSVQQLGSETSNSLAPMPTYSNLPTAKGGLQNIPARPAAHPMSNQGYGVADPKAFQNTMSRMDSGMPVEKHEPYIPGI